jgi:hypothetical protein
VEHDVNNHIIRAAEMAGAHKGTPKDAVPA